VVRCGRPEAGRTADLVRQRAGVEAGLAETLHVVGGHDLTDPGAQSQGEHRRVDPVPHQHDAEYRAIDTHRRRDVTGGRQIDVGAHHDQLLGVVGESTAQVAEMLDDLRAPDRGGQHSGAAQVVADEDRHDVVPEVSKMPELSVPAEGATTLSPVSSTG
jgi:hypothetical protein